MADIYTPKKRKPATRQQDIFAGTENAPPAPAAEHHCHWPTCDKEVPPRLWGCKPHWYTLPKYIRDKISGAYVRGQEITKTPSRAYIAAAKLAQDWIRGEIDAGRQK